MSRPRQISRHPERRATAAAALLAGGLTLAGWLPAGAAIDDETEWRDGFGRLAELAGWCWIGEFDDSELRDLHCWEWAVQNRFLRDTHRVLGGEEPYSGETLYALDPATGRLSFWYFNSLGGISTGQVVSEGDRLRFDESYSDQERELTIRSFLEVIDSDRYSAVSERREDDGWRPFMSVSFTRIGLQPPSLGGDWARRWGLAFNSNREGDYEVYRRDLRIGTVDNLTGSPSMEWAYSGGESLLVLSDREAGSEPGYRLYRLDPDSGSEMERVGDRILADSWIGVLADEGGYVVCAVESGDKELFVLDHSGAIARQLTDNQANDCQPDVDADGATVVFWSDRSGSAELWSMPLAGGEARQLTHFPGNDSAPAHRYGGEGPPRISPDGRRVAWMSLRDGTDFDIYSMAIDGTDVRRLTEHLADDGYPSWSPDGEWIAFDSDRFGDSDLFVMRPDGSELTRITDDPGNELAPVWVPRRPEEAAE